MNDRISALQAWNERAYDHAILLTYNFQADFFEEYCLEQLAALEANNNVSVVMDGRELQATLCGDRGRWPRTANVRYLLHAATPERRFHPKLALFASRGKGSLVVGSGNLTRAGLTRNAELAHVSHFVNGENEEDLSVFRDAVSLLNAITNEWPSDELASRLEDLLEDADWLTRSPTVMPRSRHRLLHNLTEALLPQLSRDIPRAVRRVYVLSPFFDSEPTVLDAVFEAFAPREVLLFSQFGAPSLGPSWVKHDAIRRRTAQLLFSEWSDEGRRQELHAKAIAIEYEDGVWRVFSGSANFTSAALLSTPRTGNVEAGIVTDGIRATAKGMQKFFDPAGAARARQPEVGKPPAPLRSFTKPIDLLAAALENDVLVCITGRTNGEALDAVLFFRDGAHTVHKLVGTGARQSCDLDPSVLARCARESVIVSVRPRGVEEESSNRTVLHNHQDLLTGSSLRRERRVREAVRSADKFAATLTELLCQNDLSAMMEFLTYCDIRLPGPGRLVLRARDAMSSLDLHDELRKIGERNLRTYQDLHDAAIGFAHRHTERLRRHAVSPSLEQVPACMHIVRSVAKVVASQIERLVVGLESTRAVSIDDWYTHRENLDAYLEAWRKVLRVASAEWLPHLLYAFPRPEIEQAMTPDLVALDDLSRELLRVHDRIIRCTGSSLSVMTPRGGLVRPPLFSRNLVSREAWPRFRYEVASMHSRIRNVA